MDKTRKLVIGSRGSKLAVLQAGMVHDALRKAFPGAGFDFRAIATTGDRDRTRSLDEVGGQGIFVKELEYALSAGEIDFAVHSLKDVPTQLDPGMALAAVLPREDPRDVLVSCSGMDLAHLPAGARIGTDSRRRAAQLKAVRPDLVACPMRGNIDTRLRKVKMGRVDGAILAAAGLLRLGLAGHVVQFLEVQQFLPAVGQGAVAIELRAGDGRAASMASAINHASTMHAVLAERAFMRTLGGGCRAPIAALAGISGDMLEMEGMVASEDYSIVVRRKHSGRVTEAETVGQTLARIVLAEGGNKIAMEGGRLEVAKG